MGSSPGEPEIIDPTSFAFMFTIIFFIICRERKKKSNQSI
jgi:hypothetical protein